MLALTNIALRRGRKVLFENASFQIHAGQRMGVIGANGSGKSSLFAKSRSHKAPLSTVNATLGIVARAIVELRWAAILRSNLQVGTRQILRLPLPFSCRLRSIQPALIVSLVTCVQLVTERQ